MVTPLRFLLWALLIGLATASTADAQGILGRARDAARRGAERAVEREAERRANAAVTNAIECALGDTACADEAREQGQDVVYVDADGNPVESAAPSGAAGAGGNAETLRPGEGAWANYDFVPGERPIFVDDFSNDRVGNFPQRLEFRSGNMQVVEWQGQRWLSAEGGELFVNLPEVLPERFTMEFDLAGAGNPATLTFDGGDPGQAPGEILLDDWQARLESGEIRAEGRFPVSTHEAPGTIRIAVDGSYVKLYFNEQRVLNVPNANLGRSDRIYFDLEGWSAEEPRMIADVRIMAGGQPMYDALMAEGRVATQGLLFDTGSARLRPESTPTLREIGDMLRQHGDLRLRIEGHTDSAGDDAANQQLSERRAQAVRDFLVASYGIDGGRLEAQGLGETQPAAGNDTPEGRQQNRRVVLVRL